ncbi:DUF1800 domain-containing protein [Glaciihabitans arcticus]|uniref:DUF1800 domain-containing protein n=1 Tax=Glaciihabitans arcticus TaxID=2668039 RepID=A0A4Q9GS19_9MICO|nr:DUF1800 domain-containing protein [Glaciihabitans arcticus]TBN57451.1 DUF1800 domain-containing protein [Glaciihabitans arcticus]
MNEIRTPQSSRRAFFGLGGLAAAGLIASDLVAAPVEPAQAAPPVPRPREVDPEPLPVRSEPFADGGPETRDASISSAVPTAAPVAPGRQYTTFSAAAKAAGASTSAVFPGYNPTGHLLRRATFGARSSDVAQLKQLGVNKWIARQLAPATFADPIGNAAWKAYPLAGASAAVIRKSIAEFSWDAVFQTAQASLARQVFSNRQIYEVTVDIFANHLHVPLPGEQWHTAPSYLTGVIRKYAFGSYTSMLLAAMKHPAMLNFLNNDESRKANVNENLGRELLELHTVGIASGYTEADVRNSAAILSGRSWNWKTGAYVYNAADHVTGPVRVLGFSHANTTAAGGQAVGDAYLAYLAKHPATARTIARKIAVRFVSDSPSDDLINRLAAVYLKKNTSILETVRAVFLSSDFWASVGTRMRRPLEDAVGTLRVLNVGRSTASKTPLSWLYWNLNEAGHTPHGWMPPNGYPDVAAAWLGAGAMIQRWNLHRTFAYGWWKGLVYIAPEKIVVRTAKMTTLQWTTAVSKKILGVAPSAAHLEAIITGVGRTPGSPAPTSGWECGKITTLLLDSPYFQLR